MLHYIACFITLLVPPGIKQEHQPALHAVGQGFGPHVPQNGLSGMHASEAMPGSGLFGGRPLLEGEQLLRQDAGRRARPPATLGPQQEAPPPNATVSQSPLSSTWDSAIDRTGGIVWGVKPLEAPVHVMGVVMLPLACKQGEKF